MNETDRHSEPPASMFSAGDIFQILRLGAVTGLLLGLPVALATKGDYFTVCLLIGIGSTFLWLVAIALVRAGTVGRPDGSPSAAATLGRFLGGLLLVGLFLGLACFIGLKIWAESHKDSTVPTYQRTYTPRFKVR